MCVFRTLSDLLQTPQLPAHQAPVSMMTPNPFSSVRCAKRRSPHAAISRCTWASIRSIGRMRATCARVASCGSKTGRLTDKLTWVRSMLTTVKKQLSCFISQGSTSFALYVRTQARAHVYYMSTWVSFIFDLLKNIEVQHWQKCNRHDHYYSTNSGVRRAHVRENTNWFDNSRELVSIAETILDFFYWRRKILHAQTHAWMIRASYGAVPSVLTKKL